MIIFLLGLFVGAILGFIAFAIIATGGRADLEMEIVSKNEKIEKLIEESNMWKNRYEGFSNAVLSKLRETNKINREMNEGINLLQEMLKKT